MSEMENKNMENNAPEAVENKAEVSPANAQPQQPELEDRENAPRTEPVPEEKPKKKNRRKKKRKQKILMALMAILVVIALVFGAVLGYIFGRNVGAERLAEAEAKIIELTHALETAAGTPAYDVFSEEMTGENREALEDLAGVAFEAVGDTSVLLGEDAFGAVQSETGTEEPVVVAEFKGGKLMSDEVAREYSEQMTNFVFAGYNEEEIAEVLLDEVLRYMVSDRILEAHAREMGLYELTEEDKARIDEEVQRNYSEQMEFYRDFVNTDGMTEEEANGAVKSYMQESFGVTPDTIRAEIESGWWAQKIYDAITADVTVDEADLQAAYEALIAEQKDSFTAYPDDFEFAQMNGETIVYNLPGYRSVRMLLFGFGSAEAYEAVSVLSEEILELDPAVDLDEITDYKAQIDSFYATPETRAQAALAEIQAGADFEEMLISIGEDEGMQDERLREMGYYVSAQSALWPREMVVAAMALENVGDISEPIRIPDGVCILQYAGEVPAGEVALDAVRDVLMVQTLEDAQYLAYETQMNQWLEEAEAVYYPERMQ